MTEFERIWNAEECTKEYDEFIEEYRKRFEEKKLFEKMVSEQKEIAKRESVPSIEAYSLKPNSMQEEFIVNLRKIMEKGEKRALLISATGERGIFVTGGRNPGFTRVSEAWS